MGIDHDMVKMLDGIDLSNSRSSSDCVRNARYEATQRKKKKIRDLLAESSDGEQRQNNLMYFRRFATTTGGLLEHEFRLAIWPVLAENIPEVIESKRKAKSVAEWEMFSNSSCSDSDFFESARSSFSSTASINGDVDEEDICPEQIATPSAEQLQSHVEWNQVELDVNRTLARFPPDISENERFSLQADLTPMIVELLFLDKSFRYYQGFHDVCLTLLLALDVDNGKRVARHLVQRSAMRNYLTKSLEESALSELHLMYVILHHCAPQVEEVLRRAELGTLFALSWPITWFSHALHSFDQVVLCFDMFLSSHYLMPIYVSAALVEHRKSEVMKCEPEMPYLHHLLNNVPVDVDIQAVLDRARDLFQLYPPGLVQGSFRNDYDQLCARERRSERAPPPPLRRHSALTAPWLMVGTAAAGVAAYWWLSKYTTEMMGLI